MKKNLRSSETEEQASRRRQNDLASKRKREVSETATLRKEKIRESVSKCRKLESNEQRSQRLQQDCACKAR